VSGRAEVVWRGDVIGRTGGVPALKLIFGVICKDH
jgi:hypothetical protein